MSDKFQQNSTDKNRTDGPLIEDFMGLSPEISDTAFIAASAVISGAVRIGDDCSIWHNVTLRGDAKLYHCGRWHEYSR